MNLFSIICCFFVSHFISFHHTQAYLHVIEIFKFSEAQIKLFFSLQHLKTQKLQLCLQELGFQASIIDIYIKKKGATPNILHRERSNFLKRIPLPHNGRLVGGWRRVGGREGV